MRIGIDCRTILSPERGEKAGVGHYTYYLVKHLLQLDRKNQYVLFFDWRYPDPREFIRKNVKTVHFPFSQYKKYLPFAYSHLLIAATLAREKLDVYHSPANVIPLNYKGKSVLTVHDLAIYEHPSWFPNHQSFATKVLVPQSIKKANKIIAVSHSTKESIIKLFHISPQKISVIYEGFAKEPKVNLREIRKIKKKYEIKDKYLFYIGTIEPRKNLETVVHAFDGLLRKNYKKYKKWQFIIAGAKGWKYEELFEAIRKTKTGHVKFISYIPHKEKIALLKGADFFVFPSLWEGFGLPVLEAMSLGTPVLTSNLSSLPEVAGSAALMVNPYKVKEITAGLKKLLDSSVKRRKLKKLGLKQARKFSWKKCSQQTLKIYDEVFKL